MILTGRTGLLALICVLPIALSPWPARAFVMLLVALAVAVTVDTLLAASTRKLRFTRSPYTSARLGQPVDASLLLCNGGRRRFRGQVRDAWPPSARAQPHTHDVDVAAGQRQQVHTALRPVRRGDQRAAIVTARSIGPLGLAGRQSSQSVPGLVRVLPPFLSRKHLPSRLAKLREIDGLLPTLIRGQGTEFDSLREYVVGDDVRSIDWRASARRADVMVRTWRPERDRRVVIVLDTGDHVDFLAHDRISRAGVFGASRSELLAQLVDAMAPLRPALIESDWHAMIATILRRTRRRSLVVLLTDLNATALDEGLLPVLPQLSARHHVLVAAVADPRVDQLAAGRSDAAAVYDAAAAERARNDRRAIASQLRRGGVDVIDAPPAEIAPGLADRYLAMKATGRL